MKQIKVKNKKRLKSLKTNIIHLRVSDEEMKKLEESAEKEQLSISVYIRKILFSKKYNEKLFDIYIEIRGMRTEIHQALIRLRKIKDDNSYKYLENLLETYKNILEEIKEILKKEMEN